MSLEDFFCTVAALVPSRRKNDSVVAICYHRLSDHYDGTPLDRFTISPKLFSRHLTIILESGLDVIGPDQFWATTKPAVMITFDDNLLSHVREALPVLVEFGVTATFFLDPGDLDQTGMLTSNEIDSLLAAGMWVGAHSDDLNVVSTVAPDEFERQVVPCREFLESLGMPLTWAYPGGYIGSFQNAHDDILRKQGFSLRFSTLDMPCDPQDMDRVQGRYVIRKNCSDRYYRSALAGGLQLLRIYKKAKARIRPNSRSYNGKNDIPRF